MTSKKMKDTKERDIGRKERKKERNSAFSSQRTMLDKNDLWGGEKGKKNWWFLMTLMRGTDGKFLQVFLLVLYLLLLQMSICDDYVVRLDCSPFKPTWNTSLFPKMTESIFYPRLFLETATYILK